MLPDYVIDCVKKIAQNEEFTDYKIEAKEGFSHGENFMGLLIAITLSGNRQKNGQNQSEELHLLCKVPPQNETRQKSFNTGVAFDHEIYTYSKLLPIFVRFQKEKGLNETDSFLSFPKVYLCDKNEETGRTMLIMEDLRVKNYQMRPRDQTIPLDHELMVLKELGKFHAVAFAMKDQEPDTFKEFKNIPDVFIKDLVNKALKYFTKFALEQSIEVLENPKHKKLMENFRDNYLERCNKLKTEPFCDDFGVIAHSDCWINNFLFQYSTDNNSMGILKSLY